MLQHCLGGERHAYLEAARLDELLDALKQRFPLLTPHVWDDQGKVRKHIMVFLNDQSIAWLPSLERELVEGDRVQIVQAVSGGRGVMDQKTSPGG